MKILKIDLNSQYQFSEGQECLLTREDGMSIHTGIYVYKKGYTGINKDRQIFALFNEDLKTCYSIPISSSVEDIKVYEIQI